MSADTEPDPSAPGPSAPGLSGLGLSGLGLRLRLLLAADLTGVAQAWIDDPGLPPPAHPARGWHIETQRDTKGAFRLRAAIADTGSDDAFIRAAFQAVLGRPPDPAGLLYYRARLAEGPMARQRLLDSLTQSLEAAERHEVFRIRRDPGPGGG